MKHNALRMAGWIVLVLAAAGGVRAEDYTYTTNLDNTITITLYTGPGGNVVIPSEINGRPVTVIGNDAFYRTNLTSVMIGGSITVIGTRAFSYCRNLASVTMGSNVTSIGESAFYSCTNLTGLTIGNSVTNIGNYAFYRCNSLTGISIPDSVTAIGGSAFASCSKLTGLTIGSNVTVIGNYAFDSCSSLTGVTIPASVTTIGDYAFSFCSSLTAITVDAANSFYRSEDGVLIDKLNARLIQCPEGKAGSVTIPSSVTAIEDYAFYNCTDLTALYFLGDAPMLGDGVFDGDDGIITATVYYLPGTDGWGATFGGLTAVPLNLAQIQLGPGFGMRTNGFGFTVTGSNGTVVVVEACTNLMGGGWKALQTNTLSGGSFLFRDPQVTNYSRRFYRLRVE